MSAVKVVVIDGARRADSASRKLVHVSKSYFEEAGAELEIFDQSINALPLFDDSDDGAADLNVIKLNELVRNADAKVLSSPEYKDSI